MTSMRMRLDEAPAPILPDERDPEVVPEPPTALCASERRWWDTLWRTPVAALWSVADGPLVVALAKLYALADEDITAGMAGQIANISSQLGLNPRSRAQLRIHFLDPTPSRRDSGGRERFRAVG